MILVINCGSSSLKFKVFKLGSLESVCEGLIEKIGETDSKIADHHQAMVVTFQILAEKGIEKQDITAVGHRVVHGGEQFLKPTLITESVIAGIRDNIELAPLHNQANLDGILACRQNLPDDPQIAVFDTSFHITLPDYAYMYALPYELYQKYKIRKYGFHGISHAYVAEEAAKRLKSQLEKLKLITVHLGNGCSVAAVDHGKCIDTSMGFTPLAGLIMGTRSGVIDPAIPLYLINHLNISAKEVDAILNKKSGLLGVSGLSNDVRVLKKHRDAGNERARLALDMYLYQIKKYVGAYLYMLGGADAIVFTAGVGEHHPDFIEMLTREMATFMKKPPQILTIPTNEELMIARLTAQFI